LIIVNISRTHHINSLHLLILIKNIVYKTPPISAGDMKNQITNVCRSIPQNILISIIENFEKRLRLCKKMELFWTSYQWLKTYSNWSCFNRPDKWSEKCLALIGRISDRSCFSWPGSVIGLTIVGQISDRSCLSWPYQWSVLL